MTASEWFELARGIRRTEVTKREKERRAKLESEWGQLSLESLLLELEARGFEQGYCGEPRSASDAKHLRDWICEKFAKIREGSASCDPSHEVVRFSLHAP